MYCEASPLGTGVLWLHSAYCSHNREHATHVMGATSFRHRRVARVLAEGASRRSTYLIPSSKFQVPSSNSYARFVQSRTGFLFYSPCKNPLFLLLFRHVYTDAPHALTHRKPQKSPRAHARGDSCVCKMWYNGTIAPCVRKLWHVSFPHRDRRDEEAHKKGAESEGKSTCGRTRSS